MVERERERRGGDPRERGRGGDEDIQSSLKRLMLRETLYTYLSTATLEPVLFGVVVEYCVTIL